MKRSSWFAVMVLVIFKCSLTDGIFLIIPEDLATGFAGIYGFSPRIVAGKDNRLGFGFRFGNHADLQVMYELGPQTATRPLQTPLRVRSARVRERVYRRRPLLEFLLRTNLLRESEYQYNYSNECDEPR